jgi:hypothetical protein
MQKLCGDQPEFKTGIMSVKIDSFLMDVAVVERKPSDGCHSEMAVNVVYTVKPSLDVDGSTFRFPFTGSVGNESIQVKHPSFRYAHHDFRIEMGVNYGSGTLSH